MSAIIPTAEIQGEHKTSRQLDKAVVISAKPYAQKCGTYGLTAGGDTERFFPMLIERLSEDGRKRSS